VGRAARRLDLGAQEVERALAGQTEFFERGRRALTPVSKSSVSSVGPPEEKPQHTSEEDAWDEPVPLNERGKVPAFPVEKMPGWMADWSTETAREKGASVDLAATLVLGVVSGALARHVQVSPRPGWYEPTNLYLVTALEPGQRKTPIFKAALRPVRAVEYHRMQDWQNANAAASLAGEILTKRRRDLVSEAAAGSDDLTEEALRERMGQLVEGLGPTETGPRPRLLTEDITPEGLTTMLADQGRVISASDEGAALFENLGGRYARGSASWDVFNKAHSAADLVVDRKGSGSEIVWDPALTLIVASQPKVLRDLWGKPGSEERGVLSRPLYAFPEPVYGTGRTLAASESVLSAFDVAIRALLEDVPLLTLDDDGKPRPVTLRFDSAAERSFERYEAEVAVERRDLGTSDQAEDEIAYLGWLSKLAGQTARLAACLHAATHWTTGVTTNTTLGVESVEHAIELARYFHAHARAAFGLMGEIPDSGGRSRFGTGCAHARTRNSMR
jgi:replicative DNA helicase